MTFISFPRGELTTVFVAWLQTRLLIGDGVAPKTGGWNDDPNKTTSIYHPYGVVLPLGVADLTGTLGDTAAYAICPYSLAYFGISREQVEMMSDSVREMSINLPLEDHAFKGLDQTSTWKIMQTRATSIGGISRTDTVDPSMYSQNDVLSIYISKEFT